MFRIILMCLLTCSSSFMPLKQSESIVSEEYTQVVEEKSKKNAITYGGYSICNFDDIISFSYLSYNYDGSGFFTATQAGTTKTAYELTNSNMVRYIAWGDINTSASDLGFSTGTGISNAYFYLRGVGSSNGVRYQSWTFYYTIGSTTRNINFDVFYNTYSSAGIELISCVTQYNPAFDFILIFDNSYKFLYEPIFSSVYQNGFSEGQRQGYNEGYTEGYDEGVDRGKEIALDPASDIYDLIFNAGYQSGYQSGVDDSIAAGTEAATIFSGIMDVAFIPVNVFFLMFNYDIFGINIAGFVSALITIAVVLILLRFIVGRKV